MKIRIIYTLAICLLALPILGFGFEFGFGKDYDDADRAHSMAPYKENKIEVTGVKGGASEKFHVDAYLRNYSGFVLGFDGGENNEEMPMAELTEDGALEFVWIKEAEPKEAEPKEAEKKNFSNGGAAPVTDDGYFITAAHVVAKENLWLVYGTDTSERPKLVCSKARIVFKDDKADFAILKADIATKRYLEVRATPLEQNELFFGGKWMASSITAGNLLSTNELVSKHGDQQITFTEVFSTNPIQGGDSGAPLIDSKGRVCGAMCGVYVGLLLKTKPKARSVMLDREALFKIINEDRAAGGGK